MTDARTPPRIQTTGASIVQINPARHAMTGRAVKLTEGERQVLLAELARVSAELHGLQNQTMDLTSRVLNASGAEEARTG